MSSSPSEATRLIDTDTLCDYVLPLPATWPQLARVSSNIRKSVRKSHKFLARGGNSFKLCVVEGVGADGNCSGSVPEKC